MPKADHRLQAARIGERIHVVRDQRVILDHDLATLYGVATKALNQAVSRNPERFPADFCFRLTNQEVGDLKSQNVTLGRRPRSLPRAFSEHGVVMLSSVLRSRRAADVSIAVVRAFVRMRTLLAAREELADRLTAIERELGRMGRKTQRHEELLKTAFGILRQLTETPARPRRRIGF